MVGFFSKIFKKQRDFSFKMQKGGLISAILLLAFSLVLTGIAFAQQEPVQQEPNIILNLRDINTNADIGEAIVYLSIFDVESGKEAYEDTVNVNRSLNLLLVEGSYKIILKADLPQTPGMDYFTEYEFSVKDISTQDIFLFPTASLRGIVKDKLDNIVGFADLRFECINGIGTEFPKTSTKFGSISIDSMPTGSCKIFASYKDAVGFEEINLNRGELL